MREREAQVVGGCRVRKRQAGANRLDRQTKTETVEQADRGREVASGYEEKARI